ncbi:hypothetical protein AX17_001470 [Amanita inopinata Kibby_2008]|nr:hypothetical protein AX17_001470 [Amanita inopinata Kibby_2008]
MIDHVLGRPNPSWKRSQVFLVIIFWMWRIIRGSAGPPRMLWLKSVNRLLKRFTPWQIILSTLTAVYALRNLDKILGLAAPEPLARLYSPSFYRATWLITGLDAGFATAMTIRPRWLRDICSIIFSGYYIIYASDADEKLRKFRAVPTVEMLRTTWEKTSNPYIRFATPLRHVSVKRKLFIPRPECSSYDRPITAYLFFCPPEDHLCKATELILDFPGGGFVAMTPEHHEERLRTWAAVTRRPILSIEYGKAPEYPYPFAIDEAFDAYRTLVDSVGRCIGMSGQNLRVILSGDSAGATLAVNVVTKILELRSLPRRCRQVNLPLPVSLVLNYAALDFNFTSWMSNENLRVLRSEQSSGNLPGLQELAVQKDHLKHVSPLSMVRDKKPNFSRSKQLKRRRSWKDTIRALTGGADNDSEDKNTTVPALRARHSHSAGVLRTSVTHSATSRRRNTLSASLTDDKGSLADTESEDEDFRQWKEEDRPIQARILYSYNRPVLPSNEIKTGENRGGNEIANVGGVSPTLAGKPNVAPPRINEPIGTRLTMTSRTGYFQDRIISPSMMRAMAIMYIGPHRNPDFATDYRISPILTPSHLLAQFPPLLMQCGERDPFVDDTVIFAGRVREAKRARKIELELMISGKSARFGEGLRMSRNEDSLDPNVLAALKREQEKLSSETEDDWVQMNLFSDWSHGYLQMPTLMYEARAVIEELAEWIDDAFVRFGASNSVADASRDISGVKERIGNHLTISNRDSLRVPSPFTSASETDAEEPGITFVPKKHHDVSTTGCFDISTQECLPAARFRLSHEGTENSSGSDRTLVDEGVETDKQVSKDQSLEDVKPRQAREDHGKVLEMHKPGTPRQAGQTITETELMRRRRLLDAHIFD